MKDYFDVVCGWTGFAEVAEELAARGHGWSDAVEPPWTLQAGGHVPSQGPVPGM